MSIAHFAMYHTLRCIGSTKAGKSCGAPARRGRVHCWWHPDPEAERSFCEALLQAVRQETDPDANPVLINLTRLVVESLSKPTINEAKLRYVPKSKL